MCLFAAVPLFSPACMGDHFLVVEMAAENCLGGILPSCSSSCMKRDGKATNKEPERTKRIGNQHGMRIALGPQQLDE